MARPHLLDLNYLANDHSAEIVQMLAGIQCGSDAVLWTSQMRAAVRGAKPLGDPRIEDAADSDRNE